MDRVPSTQDVAMEELADLPILVLAQGQTEGRGRSGSSWLSADRALAASLAFISRHDDQRPFSLIAGVAAARVTRGSRLKWPNDVMRDGAKVGGILVERSAAATVVGLGLNLWWPEPPEVAGALFDEDPGSSAHLEVGSLWGAETMALLDTPGWPRDEYLELCVTLGEDITWEPEGQGRAIDVTETGALLVETTEGRQELYSGAVRHIR